MADKIIQHWQPAAIAGKIAYDMARGYFSSKNSTRSARGRSSLKRKPSYRRTRAAKRKVYRSSKKATMYKQIRDIKRTLRSDQARHTFRARTANTVQCGVNQANYANITQAVNTANLEAAMANLRYYNPAVPGTLTTADASSGTYTRQIHFESIYRKLVCRNNYQVPCKVTILSFQPKHDTNNTPTAFYIAGVTDQTIGGSATSPISYITDIDMVRDNWKVMGSKSATLQPGQELKYSCKLKAFDYDPSNADTHNLSYQRKYQSHIFVVRVEGVIGHDTAVATEHTTLSCGIDFLQDTKYVMTYDAGVNLNDYSYDNENDTAFTNAGVVSNKPVSDNQSYSVA